jgi:hypothetical protein
MLEDEQEVRDLAGLTALFTMGLALRAITTGA